MFLEVNELRGLIVDLDSFPIETDHQWFAVADKLQVLVFSKDKSRLESFSGTSIIPSARSPIVIFFNVPRFRELVSATNLPSYELAFVTASFRSIELLLSTVNFASILISKDKLTQNELGHLPDFMIPEIATLKDIIDKSVCGYYAELSANLTQFSTGSLIVLAITINGVRCPVWGGGRYFGLKSKRAYTHQLSQRIRKNKYAETRQNPIFIPVYESIVEALQKTQHFDLLTRVPPRPSSPDDRFADVVTKICSKGQIGNALSDLFCVRDYSSQKRLSAAEREKNVEGAFAASANVRGKKILLLDDVWTTGGTASECIKTLLDAGASYVGVFVLGINQFDRELPWFPQKPLLCPKCNNVMDLRLQKSGTLSAFFGCSKYPNCRNTVNYLPGLRQYNIQNGISIEAENADIEDLF